MADLSSILTELGMLPQRAYKAVVPTNVRAYLRGMSGETSPVGNEFFTDEDIQALRQAATDSLISDRQLAQRRLNFLSRTDLEQLAQPYFDFLNGSNNGFSGEALDAARIIEGRVNPQNETIQLENLLKDLGQDSTNPMSRVMTYDAYQNHRGEPWSLSEMLDTFYDPMYRMKTTIGGAMLERDSDGNVILKDQYNFNRGSLGLPQQRGLYGLLHQLGEKTIGGGNVVNRNYVETGEGPPVINDESKGYPIQVNLGKWGTDVKAQ